jgi:hypothetical protein
VDESEKLVDVRIVENKSKSGWDTFRNIMTLITAFFAVISLIFSYCNFKNASESGQKTKEYVDTLNSGIKNVSVVLKDLPISVQLLDSSIIKMQSQLGTLRETANLFKTTLAEMNNVADTQLALIRQTQKHWETELSRKANIILGRGQTRLISDTLLVTPVLTNIGNKGVSSCMITLEVPRIFGFGGSGWVKSDSLKDSQEWTYTYQWFITPVPDSISKGTTAKYMSFSLLIPKDYKKKTITLNYSLFHEAYQEGALVIPIEDYNPAY